MTKNLFAILCLVVLVIMFAGFFVSYKRKEEIRKPLLNLITISMWVVLISIIEMLTSSFVVMKIMRTCFYVAMDWICLYILLFCSEYAKIRVKKRTIIDRIYAGVLGVDSLMLFFNLIVPIAVKFTLVQTETDTFLQAEQGILYDVHLVLCYLMLLKAFYSLIKSLIKAPGVYRIRYITTLITLLAVVALDAWFLTVGWFIDISILLFGLAELIIVYFTFFFVPQVLKHGIQERVFEQMKDCVVIFDDDNICVYANNKFEPYGVQATITKDDCDEIIKKLLNGHKYFSINSEGTEKYFSPNFNTLFDRKNTYMGCFYVLRDITEETEHQKEQHRLSNHDTLTGLYNRNYFTERATDFMHDNPDEQYLLVCSDIRHFKTLNDMFGVRIGDEVLKAIANGLITNDKGNMIYGRIGDDSFALCIPEKEFHLEFLVSESKRLLKLSYLSYAIINHIGIYRVEDIDIPVSTMCDRAMMAINNIRSDFQTKVAYYDDSLRNKFVREQEIVSNFESAFEDDSFVIFLQPQYNIKSHRVTGAEALVRWKDGKDGFISPGEFIPVLENHGLITRLDIYVWNLVAELLRKWKNEGRDALAISVNISPKDFYYADLYEVFTGLTESYGISPKNLRLEITESAFAMDFEKQQETVERLQKAGFLIEMDDFGKGYSSLNSLKDTPVDILKLDIDFLKGKDKYNRGAGIISTVVKMADGLHMPVIAEGVETKAQCDFLQEVGCDIIQGYYYSKPMSVSDFENKIRDFY